MTQIELNQRLQAAAAGGLPEALRGALAEGADPNYAPPGAWPPLCASVMNGSEDCVRLLLEAGGAAHNETWIDSPWRIAVALNEMGCLRALIESGAEVDARFSLKRTALMEAFSYGECRLEAVRALLAAGADINAADEKGRTPLLRAAGSGWRQAVEVALSFGADPFARDAVGRDALETARYEGSAEPEIVAMSQALEAARESASLRSEIGSRALPAAKGPRV